MEWKFLNKPFLEPSKDVYGFIYKLTFFDKESGTFKYYIGKKNFWFLHCKKALMLDKKRKGHIKFVNKRYNGRLLKHEIFIKESDWRKYEGSFKGDRTNLELVEKEILYFAESKRHLTYLEARTLFNENVLESDSYLNENILGRFFRGNLK